MTSTSPGVSGGTFSCPAWWGPCWGPRVFGARQLLFGKKMDRGLWDGDRGEAQRGGGGLGGLRCLIGADPRFRPPQFLPGVEGGGRLRKGFSAPQTRAKRTSPGKPKGARGGKGVGKPLRWGRGPFWGAPKPKNPQIYPPPKTPPTRVFLPTGRIWKKRQKNLGVKKKNRSDSTR